MPSPFRFGSLAEGRQGQREVPGTHWRRVTSAGHPWPAICLTGPARSATDKMSVVQEEVCHEMAAATAGCRSRHPVRTTDILSVAAWES
ncbi:MAG: hypothetical protein RLY70_2702 [Planctomycetota bacterium]|jgi:hypothetical protein